jgi:hypothetical protein
MEGHRLAGDLSVDASARLIRHYRYVEERMMRVMGGWIALTPELPAKLLLGRHVWDCAQHADLWGRRLPELRTATQQSEPANEAVVRFMDTLEAEERYTETPERLAGIYGVLKPHLLSVYMDHRARANPVFEPPTRRILDRCVDEELRHAAAGQIVLDALSPDPERRRRAEAWAEKLQRALQEAGGITGNTQVLAGERLTHPRAYDDVISLGRALARPDLPVELGRELDRHRRAVEAGDLVSLAGQVFDAEWEHVQAEYRGLSFPLAASEVVAVAKIGAYRMVKLAFKGPRGLAVVQQQWRQTDDTWRLYSAEVVRIEPAV